MTDKEVIIIDGKDCTNCSKLSHCNNNNLICRSRYYEVKEESQRLQAENEELKKQLQNPDVIVALTDVRTGERELWYNKGLKADRYKQALEEIKNILEVYFDDDWKAPREIEKKINEVLNDN